MVFWVLSMTKISEKLLFTSRRGLACSNRGAIVPYSPPLVPPLATLFQGLSLQVIYLVPIHMPLKMVLLVENIMKITCGKKWTRRPRLESLLSARGRYFSRQICTLRKTTLSGSNLHVEDLFRGPWKKPVGK